MLLDKRFVEKNLSQGKGTIVLDLSMYKKGAYVTADPEDIKNIGVGIAEAPDDSLIPPDAIVVGPEDVQLVLDHRYLSKSYLTVSGKSGRMHDRCGVSLPVSFDREIHFISIRIFNTVFCIPVCCILSEEKPVSTVKIVYVLEDAGINILYHEDDGSGGYHGIHLYTGEELSLGAGEHIEFEMIRHESGIYMSEAIINMASWPLDKCLHLLKDGHVEDCSKETFIA